MTREETARQLGMSVEELDREQGIAEWLNTTEKRNNVRLRIDWRLPTTAAIEMNYCGQSIARFRLTEVANALIDHALERGAAEVTLRVEYNHKDAK